MTAATGPRKVGMMDASPRQWPVKSGVTVKEGWIVGRYDTGTYKGQLDVIDADPGLICEGFARHTVTGDGATDVYVDEGIIPLFAAGLDESAEGQPAYGVDNQTFSLTPGAGPCIGLVHEVTSATEAYCKVGRSAVTIAEMVIAKAEADAAIGLAKKTVTIGHADLTDAVNGEAQVINIGTALPANAVVLAHEVNVATLFSGGSASAVKLDVGGTTADAIVSQQDVFTGADTGALSLRTGTHAQGKFSSEQLVATFTPDGGHTLAGLSAGSLTITVWYAVLA